MGSEKPGNKSSGSVEGEDFQKIFDVLSEVLRS
jgi:hypothetical protein